MAALNNGFDINLKRSFKNKFHISANNFHGSNWLPYFGLTQRAEVEFKFPD